MANNVIAIAFQKLRQKAPKQLPKLVTPYRPLGSMLVDLFDQNDKLNGLLDTWKALSSSPGVYNRPMDGLIWKSLKTSTGELFFDQACSNEVCIGVTLAMDWLICCLINVG
jgi:hypothetical protein